MTAQEAEINELRAALNDIGCTLRKLKGFDALAQKRIDRMITTVRVALNPVEIEPQQVACELCGTILEPGPGPDDDVTIVARLMR